MKNRKLTRLIFETSIKLILILLMIIAPFSSYGWFAGNKTANHGNMQMSLRSDDAIASYKVYLFNSDKGVNRGVLDSEKTVSEDTESKLSLEMNEYDTIFTKRNRYTPAFIRIELMKLDATPKEGTVNVTLTKKDFDTVEIDEKYYDCISQVVRFTAVVDHDFEDDHTFTSITQDPISPAEIDEMEDDNDDPLLSTKHHLFYTYVDEKLYNNTKHAGTKNGNKITPKIDNTVVTSDSNIFYTAITTNTDANDEVTSYTMTATDTITLSAPYTSADWTTVSTDDGDQQVLNVYIYLTYDDGLIECYKTNHDMNILSIGEDKVPFENNLDQIKISFTTGG